MLLLLPAHQLHPSLPPLAAQAAFNSELSATGALMASTLVLLQQQLTRCGLCASSLKA
jgi:hypothetical protein